MIRLLTLLTALLALTLPARAAIDIQEVQSDSGLTAWLMEDHSLPFVALELRFRGGTSLDPADKPGAVMLMTALLEEGSAGRSAQDFAEEAEGLGAEFGFDAGPDTLAVSARILSDTRAEAVTLLHDALTTPDFPEDAVARVRGQLLSVTRRNAVDPGALSSRATDQLIFGTDPYARPSDGTPESVAALTLADLRAAHGAALTRDRVFIGAAGDITPDELAALLDRLLGDLPAQGPALSGPAEVTLPGDITLVPFDTPQSEITFVSKGIPMEDPAFFAAYTANHILGGGGLTSRLSEEVREKRGLTYGIGTYLIDMDRAALLMGRVATQNARVGETLAVTRDEWARIGAEGVTQAELDRAKTYLTGEYPLRFDGNGPISSILAGMQMRDMPRDYITTRNDRIEALTLDEVNAAAARLFDPETLTFVIAGAPEGVDAPRVIEPETLDDFSADFPAK